MKRLLINAAVIMTALTIGAQTPVTERIVLLHTNDTHSQIDPDDKGRGGVVRRKALVDSVRIAEPNVLLVDAGDAVQGTPYFTLFGGEVEQEVLNRLGYDVQIIGNHEFDNGVEALAKSYRKAWPTVVSSNNLFDGTPLDDIFVSYVVKQAGSKRIGFLGLNIDPDGLVDMTRCKGVAYTDGLEAANRVADFLRDSAKVDAVVAVTHIGYRIDPNSKGYTDPQIAAGTRNIDVIIGGHSHTELKPGSPETKVVNQNGDTVLIVQNSNSGKFVGEVMLGFDASGALTAKDWQKLPVGAWNEKNGTDSGLADYLRPFRAGVDSLMNVGIGTISGDFDDQAMVNFASDFVRQRGTALNGGRMPDLAIMNKGGVRRNFTGKRMTLGMVMTVFPFDNRIVLVDIKGSELRKIFDIMARQKANGVSSNVAAVMAPDFSACESVTVNGKPLDDNRTYRVATIDYLAGGNDNMKPFLNGKVVRTSDGLVYDDMINAFRYGLFRNVTVKADSTPHMTLRGNPDFVIKNH